MGPDNILMIPHLSKELNLIGYPALPYTLKKRVKRKSSSKSSEEVLEIVFNSRLMVEALTSTCFELVKHVKRIGEDDNSTLDKLNFENLKLERQLKLNNSETEKIISELTSVRKLNQHLREKVDQLQQKLKQSEIEHQSIAKKNQTNEDILKHALKRKESDIFELHKAIWKQLNMADQNYLPQNFELIQLNQPDFSKLWSTVKYSNAKTREEALKKAVCIFENNSKNLMEENFSLKTSFLTLLQEIDEVFKLMIDKLHMPSSILIRFTVNDIFENVEKFNLALYTSIMKKHFEIITKLCELFDEASFSVSDDLFVCWSSITKNLEDFLLSDKI